MDSANVMVDLIAALGPMGFVFWLVWRTTSHTIPRLAQRFEEGMERQRQDFKEILYTFQENEQRIHEKEIDRICNSIDNLAAKMVSPEEATQQLVVAVGELKKVISNDKENAA